MMTTTTLLFSGVVQFWPPEGVDSPIRCRVGGLSAAASAIGNAHAAGDESPPYRFFGNVEVVRKVLLSFAPGLFFLWLVACAAAQAAEPAPLPARANRSPVGIRLGVDLTLTLAPAMVGLMPDLIKSELGSAWCDLDCDPGRLPGIDRPVIHNRSTRAATFSDGLMVSGLLLPYLAGLLDWQLSRPADGLSGVGKDSLVISQALSLNYFANQVVKFAVRRPRPYVYDSAVAESTRTNPESGLSYYSSHTSTVFCAATSYSLLFHKRHPGSKIRYAVWIGAHLLAGTVGFLRVEAGKHFWTDVLSGAAAGSAVGYLTTWLHLEE